MTTATRTPMMTIKMMTTLIKTTTEIWSSLDPFLKKYEKTIIRQFCWPFFTSVFFYHSCMDLMTYIFAATCSRLVHSPTQPFKLIYTSFYFFTFHSILHNLSGSFTLHSFPLHSILLRRYFTLLVYTPLHSFTPHSIPSHFIPLLHIPSLIGAPLHFFTQHSASSNSTRC